MFLQLRWLCSVVGLSLFLGTLGNPVRAQDESTVSFARDIRPILSDRCFACHGPDPHAREAGLRLDQPDGPEGAHAWVITPGSAEESELWHRITASDPEMRMPPPEAHGKPLSAAEQRHFRQWIETGATYDTFWAFQPPSKPELPPVQDKDNGWSDQPIDRFVLQELESQGMEPSDQANPRTLVRRATLDLTGLPPTRQEVRDFLRANRASPEHAWEALVDRLIAKPQYGEHMARYWLDLVRFADTNGMHKDFYRNHVAYRDWVIRSFNSNLPYDDFVRYQLAGDLFDSPTNDQLIASGFHRLHLIIDRGTALPEESFTKNVLDRVTSVGTAFMGMTVHCAQCHDHKYDPITQEDFYSLYAFFNNIDAEPETRFRPENGLQPPYISLATDQQKKQQQQLDRRISEIDQKIQAAQEQLEKLSATSGQQPNLEAAAGTNSNGRHTATQQQADGDTQPDLDALGAQLEQLQQRRKQLERQRSNLKQQIDYAMVMKERPTVRPTYLLKRGQYDAPGRQVQRDTPDFLPPLNKTGEVATRMDLANWFVARENPLTARVAVNRIWQQFFGVGLVKTSEDFGAQGDVPSHPELLDYLAVSFIESEWDIKALVKQIVMSNTYRQSSHAMPEQFRKDPDNRMLARGSRFRLDAEVIRDQILATSGLLSKKMFGPSVKPPQPDGLWKAVTMTGQVFEPDEGEAIYRRSVYTFWKRAMPPPQMSILNAPTRAACIARRERTNTPSQALLLLNEPEYLKAARHLALKVLRFPADKRIDYAWEIVTSQLPDASERSALRSLLQDLTRYYRRHPELAARLCGDPKQNDSKRNAEVAAWTMVGNTLYNLDVTKTRE